MSRATYTTNLVPNASRAQLSHSSNVYISFNMPGTSTFTIDSIAAANGGGGDTVVVHLENSNGDILEKTIEVDNLDRMYYPVGLSISVPENGWVYILLKHYGCNVYWEYTSAQLPFGYTGRGSSVTEIDCYDFNFTVEYNYEPKWEIDSQNDDYPYPAGTDPTVFTEFEKGQSGYPKNFGVWKLDDQNEGYPWPTGYLPKPSYIEIDTIEKLIALSNGEYGRGSSNKYLDVVLINDIDFADYEQGYSWNGLTDTWYMHFDGQGHSIKNIYCQATSAWGFVKSLHGNISNLYLTDISVTGTSTVAGMADALASGSFIYNCHISGVIDASSNAAGFVRRGNANTYIKNCSYNGTVKSRTQNAVAFFYDRDTSSSALQVFNSQFTGELISVSKACSCFGNGVAQVVNCEFRGKITAGGALYYLANGGIIINCLAVFSSESSWASINTSGTAYNCYYDETALGRTITTKMTAATTVQLKNKQWMNAHMLACAARR